MIKQYDILENQAHRQAGITPGTNRSEINNKQRSIINNFIRDGVRRNPERYANDPRASKYLKDTSYEDFQNLPQKETNNYQQDEEPLNDYDESSLYPEEQIPQDNNEDPSDEDDEEATDSDENNLLNKEKNQQKDSDPTNNNFNKEENFGKNAAEKSGANVAEKGATTAAESGSTAAATEGAIAAEEGAALAAEGAAAAAEATAMAAEGAAVAAEGAVVGWPVLVGIIIALILFFIIFFFLQNLAIAYPGEVNNDSSTGATICLDAGHPPNGAGGEPATNLKVAKDVQTELEKRGYKVIMTRTDSSAVSIEDRPQKCKAGNADFMYSFHADGTDRSGGYPYQIYMKSSRKLSSKSKADAQIIQDEVASAINGLGGLKDGGICAEGSCTAVNSLGIFSGADDAGIPAVLTEAVQMKNGKSVLDDDATRAKFVQGVANGITKLFPITESNDSGSNSDIVNKELALARKQIGKPYKWGASGPNSFDCSGLVLYVFKKAANINFTHSSSGQYKSSLVDNVKSGDEQPGDLIFFGPNVAGIHHVAIVSGNGKMIEAPHTGANVREVSYKTRDDIVGFKRPKVNE